MIVLCSQVAIKMIRLSDDSQLEDFVKASSLIGNTLSQHLTIFLDSGYGVKSRSGAGSNTQIFYRSLACAKILRRVLF
jgi:hypothetical protein